MIIHSFVFDLEKFSGGYAVLIKVSQTIEQYLKESNPLEKDQIDWKSIPSSITEIKIDRTPSGLTNEIPTKEALMFANTLLKNISTSKVVNRTHLDSGYSVELAEDTTNLKLLANDDKFRNLIKIEKDSFDYMYDLLIKLKD